MPAKRLAGLAAVVVMAGLTTGCCAWCQRHCSAPAPTCCAPAAPYCPPAPACCAPAPAPACCAPAPSCCAPAGYPPAPAPAQGQWQRTYQTPGCCQ